MKTFVTEIWATNPNALDSRLIKWAGPNVLGNTHEEAERYCQENGLGYAKVIGELIEEVPWSIAEHATTLYSNRDN